MAQLLYLEAFAGDPQFVCRTSDVSSAAEGDALVYGQRELYRARRYR